MKIVTFPTITLFNSIASFISLIASLSVILTYLASFRYAPEMTSRTAFKFTFLTSIFNILLHSSQIFQNNLPPNLNIYCNSFATIHLFLMSCCMLIPLFILINLQQVFIYNKPSENIFKYFLCIVCVSATTSVIPYGFNKYTSNNDGYTCFFNNDEFNYFKVFNWYVPTLLVMSSTIILSIRLFLKLRDIKSSLVLKPSKSSDIGIKILSILSSRVCFYPLVSILFVILCILDLIDSFKNVPVFLPAIVMFFASCLGTFEAILFYTVDPTWNRLKYDTNRQRDLESYPICRSPGIEKSVISYPKPTLE